jgi:hypothetical protein
MSESGQPPMPVEETPPTPAEEMPPPSVAAEADISDEEVEQQIRRMSRRSLLWGAVAIGAGLAGREWLITRREDNGIPWPFRRALEVNEQLARDYFRPTRLAPNFSASMAGMPRENGDLGLPDEFDPSGWKLRVMGTTAAPAASDSDEPVLELRLREIKALPRVEMVTELKCIEGWSQVVHWTGARLADFIAKYPPNTRSGDPADIRQRPEDLVGYVSLETPDQGYYVGLDMESALHPQTLLCYEMNGRPLTLAHGAPLRLVIPVKYGIKSIKRIGTIRFTDTRPADYWAEQGYDWYAGH